MRHKAKLIVCLAAIMASGTVGWSEENASADITIPAVSVAPVLDGILNDACWQKATVLDRLYLHDKGQPESDTTIRLAHDDTWLYVGMDCRNPRMTYVRQQVFNRDGSVFRDDSVEMFIAPDNAKKRYYHFALNFANIQHDKRFTEEGVRDEGWSASWRSATRRSSEGWTAELAIPLFVFECDDLSGLRMNLGRNFIDIELDAEMAPKNERRWFHVLRADNKGNPHDFKNFAAVAGLGGFKPQVPFAPRILSAAATGYRRENDKLTYGVELALESGSPVAGEADLVIVEERATGAADVYTERIALDGGASRQVGARVPAMDFGERNVTVCLVEPGRRDNVLATCDLETESSLKVLRKAFVGRSYYTTEATAALRLEIGLSPEMLRDMKLTVDLSGKIAFEQTGLQEIMTPEIPLAGLPEGEHPVTVRLFAQDQELTNKTLALRCLRPRPGMETKLDFIKGIMLKDDKPYFNLAIFGHTLHTRLDAGLCDDDEERIFKLLGEDIGFNTIVRTRGKRENIDRYMKLAAKYGLNVITWSYPRVAQPMSMIKPPDPENLNLPLHLKNALDGKGTRALTEADRLPIADRLLIRRAVYEQLEPEAIDEIKLLRDYPNLIGYYNQDEPNLPIAEDRIAIAEWYWKTVTPLDSYRPLMLMYARHIPHGDNWTRWGDILGYDVYPSPHSGGDVYNSPGLGTAYYAYDLRERCRHDNKVMWFVPVTTLIGIQKQPIGMNKAHVLCQAYSAIIYGARGLMYFSLSATMGEDGWDALRTVCAQVKEMAPALLNGEIAQTVRYNPDDFLPRERKFPMVNAVLFQYPDGDYLLLAANFRSHAVETEFRVAGARNAQRLFAKDGQPKLRDGAFTDKLEPYGVRAWRMKLEKAPTPLELEVKMTAIPEEQFDLVDVAAIARQLMLSKNHVPNPCFKQQTNKGFPDFYNPYFCLSMDPDAGKKGSTWFIDDEVKWNGNPSLRMFRRPLNEPGPKTRGTWGAFYPPAGEEALQVTFSFYARGDKTGARANFVMPGIKDANKSFLLTEDWVRYQLTFDLPKGSGRRMGIRTFIMSANDNHAVWINGLQLEKGDKATEFQDDSVLLKKK